MNESERRHLLRDLEKDDRYWDTENSANKPEWVKQKEKREDIGGLILWLFTDPFGIMFSLFIGLVVWASLH